MNELRVYIIIEDPKTKNDVSIKGNFDILRSFLAGVGCADTPGLLPANKSEPEQKGVIEHGSELIPSPRVD